MRGFDLLSLRGPDFLIYFTFSFTLPKLIKWSFWADVFRYQFLWHDFHIWPRLSVNSTVPLSQYFYTRVTCIANVLWMTYELYVFVSLIVKLPDQIMCRNVIRVSARMPVCIVSCCATIVKSIVIQVYLINGKCTASYVYKPKRCTKFLWLDFIFH